MKTKFLLSVMALICGVAMSFTSVELGGDLANDYVKLGPNQWMPIREIDCGTGQNTCQVKLHDGSIHPVYDTETSSLPKTTSSTVPFNE